jgi:hypothetical protein
MLGRRHRVRVVLPLYSAAGAAERSKDSEVEVGQLPLAARPVSAGETIEFLNWICFGEKDKDRDGDEDPIAEVVRYVTREDKPIFRFETAEARRAGECASFLDTLDTTPMEPGSYTYHVRWAGDGSNERLDTEAAFEITVASPRSTVPEADEEAPARPTGG